MVYNLTNATDSSAGYGSAQYAESLSEFGTPLFLPRSGGWLLERSLNGYPYADAMGCYPLFSCRDWSGLKADLEALATELVCVSLVTNPFGNYSEHHLRDCFKDRFVPFKMHYVAATRRDPTSHVSKHHRYYAWRALRDVEVERCDDPHQFLNEWVELYNNLIDRHRLRGIKAFSHDAFSIQLAVPGAVMLRARHRGETVAAHLWYLVDDVAYSHLAATSSRGYELMASYALHWSALETFAHEVAWIHFGSGSGTGSSGAGLTQFKKGWATDMRQAYFCGRIFDYRKYDEAVAAIGAFETTYFPAYRQGEFV